MARIAFLHKSPQEYLGVLSLCAYVEEKGHEVEIFILSLEGKHFWDKIKEFKPDFVGLSAVVGNHIDCYRLARAAKDRLGVGTIFGGPYASYYPDCIEREEIDVLIRGEGEEALMDFLNAYDRNEDYSHIPNLWMKRNGATISNPVRPFETDLNRYPIPDRIYYYKYATLREAYYKFFVTGRGCPYNCYFCFNQEFRRLYNFKGGIVRRYSPEHVIQELIQCKEKYPLKRVCFADDIFTIQKQWLTQFLPLYKKEIGVPFSCHCRADMDNEDIVRLLRENGCDYVMVGLESGNPRVRNEILGKKISNERFYRAAELLHKYGIRIRAYNIMGSPTETLKEALETMELNSRAKIDYPTCALFQPYQGTKTDAIAKELGYLDKNFSLEDLVGSYDFGSYLNQPEIEEVKRAHKLFYIGARHHRWIPLIRKVVRYNLGPIYTLIYLLTSFIRYMHESGDSFLHTVVIGLRYFVTKVLKREDRMLD
ncbi:hypothetical protein AMJ74_02950 [candidate division WOR_3 bacterium SM1_77]|uniref:Uncharacterized protein n=1 Tax=candidate division WOR_3 bacterium SM1_77 TaxID=1703778 RepID=A0A0S8JYS8_UNCW3|nr:MAG: hypothetical protein AMJ74_02950 [candidate division WOR_3 bacterium SM1_77]